MVPAGTYAIAKTISFLSRGDSGAAWGLHCQGATLRSRITNRESVMRMESRHVVWNFRLTGGLSIQCNGSEGNGLHILALSPTVYFAAFVIDGLSVQGAGQHGCLLEGDVFECAISNCYFMDNKQNGMTLAQSHKGIISSVNVMNCLFSQNGNIGMACVNFDGPHGGPTDVRVYGGYPRDNWGYGFFYNNRTRPAAPHPVGFEDKRHAYNPGDTDRAPGYAPRSVRMKDRA